MNPWRAHFVAADVEPDSAPLFRRDFDLDPGHGPVESAILTLSALGICEAWINGRPASDSLLTPGWTSYEWRLHYVEHDVTSLIETRSTLTIAVGNGWYRGRLGWIETRRYGDDLAAFAQLRLRFADGHEQYVATDESWTVGPSEITADDFYDGQTIDARRRDDRAKLPGFNDPAWGRVRLLPHPRVRFELDPAPPVRRVDELPATKIWRSPTGAVMVDFGENIVGFVRIRVRGERGNLLTVRHAEVLEDGELAGHRTNIRHSICTRKRTFAPPAREPSVRRSGRGRRAASG